MWTGSIWNKSGLVGGGGYGEHGNDLLDSINDVEFFDKLSDCQLFNDSAPCN